MYRHINEFKKEIKPEDDLGNYNVVPPTTKGLYLKVIACNMTRFGIVCW